MRVAGSLVLGLCLCLGSTSAVLAKRTINADQPIKIRAEIQQVVGVIFPERVASATPGMPQDRMQVGKSGALLTLLPIDPTIPPGRVFVVGETGTIYVVHYEPVSAKGDDEVYITRASPAKKVEMTAETLMRGLLASPLAPLALPGAKVQESVTPFLPVPPADDLRLLLRSARLESVNDLLALRVQLENTQDTPLLLDYRVGTPSSVTSPSTIVLDRWVWPPRYDVALLVLDQDILSPHGSTTLYVIYKERK